MTWPEVVIILCGFFLHLCIQSSYPLIRYVSTGALIGLLTIFLSIWAGVEAFEIMKGFVS